MSSFGSNVPGVRSARVEYCTRGVNKRDNRHGSAVSCRLLVNRPRVDYIGFKAVMSFGLLLVWFRNRYLELKIIYSRALDASRFEGVAYPIVNAYFDALTNLFLENSYPSDAIFNVDETGFALKDKRKQEWIIAIECFGASGVALPPLLIFKAKYTNTAWILASTPENWKFSTSTSRWTSDSYGYEWSTTLFEPETRRNDGKRRLLLLDRHGSHLTARFIAFYLDKDIDLVVLPPHTSHILQPLDVGVFSPLKRALSAEIEKLFCLDTRRIPQIEWTEAYITARAKIFTTRNVESSFRVTPPPITTPNDLDRSLLDSSPPEGTELREATSLINSIVRSSPLETPVKLYIERLGSALERTASENTLLRRENAEFRELLSVRKERKKGKRVAVKGKFVFNTKEILELVEEAEAEASKRKSKKRGTTRATTLEIEDEGEEGIEENIYESESDYHKQVPSRSSTSLNSDASIHPLSTLQKQCRNGSTSRDNGLFKAWGVGLDTCVITVDKDRHLPAAGKEYEVDAPNLCATKKPDSEDDPGRPQPGEKVSFVVLPKGKRLEWINVEEPSNPLRTPVHRSQIRNSRPIAHLPFEITPTTNTFLFSPAPPSKVYQASHYDRPNNMVDWSTFPRETAVLN
ncbi:hypothetical protein Q7P35_002920 [Cladosporium inversicolor]